MTFGGGGRKLNGLPLIRRAPAFTRSVGQMMRERFGEQYPSYLKGTGRLLSKF
jgi:hypothetical protein